MRCDLHVHTTHSGMCTVPVLSRFCRESYNDPLALYERLKQRGMDLVTVTDHDSIDAVEELRRFPDFFLSEEVSCTMPSGTEMHAGVYGIEERDHIQLQSRRHDVESLLAYAAERKLFVTVNHLYSSLTGSRTDDDFAIFARDFHGVETLNGMMLPRSNRLAADFARRYNKPAMGGSDGHSLGAVGRTWTEVAGAAGIEDFLAGMRRGHTLPAGASGDYWKLTATVCDIGVSFLKANPLATLAGGIMALAPVITLGNYIREVGFAWYWGQRNTAANSRLSALPENVL
jgi:predicted metal-dependent phosphoesterase TrpH